MVLFNCAYTDIEPGFDPSISREDDDVFLEHDYADSTNLYDRLEVKDWVGVVKFLDTGYWPGSLFMDPLPPKRQARTWIVKHVPGTQQIKWRQLPIHLAVIMDAPLCILKRLLDFYPASIRLVDDEQQLPLHLALRQGLEDDKVDFLLGLYPEAVHLKGKANRTALDCAKRSPRHQARARILSAFTKVVMEKAEKPIPLNKTASLLDVEERDQPEEEPEEDQAIRQTLSKMELVASKSFSSTDLKTIRDEVNQLKKYLLERNLTTSIVQGDIERLQCSIDAKLEDLSGKTQQELLAMQLAMQKEMEDHRQMDEALSELRAEVEKLKAELVATKPTTTTRSKITKPPSGATESTSTIKSKRPTPSDDHTQVASTLTL